MEELKHPPAVVTVPKQELLEPAQIAVYVAPLPFAQQHVKYAVGEGLSIANILTQVIPNRVAQGVTAVVTIDGMPIPQSEWLYTIPKVGQLVNVRVVPQGGKGKNPLLMVAMIAVVIAAPYIGGMVGVSALNAGIGLTAGQGILLGKLAAAGFVMLAGLAANALFAVPPQSGASANPSSSPTQFIEGSRNSLTAYAVVPVCLGTNRMFPPQGAKPYTETVGDDQYVRQIFMYGLGNKVEVANIRIGDTPIEQFADIELEHRLAGNLHTGTTLYANDVNQVDLSILLQEVDSWSQRTLPPGADEFSIDLTFAQGLTRFSNSGRRTSQTVEFEAQWAPTGTSDWSPSIASYTPISSGAYNLANIFPELAVQTWQNTAERRSIVYVNAATGQRGVIHGTTMIWRHPGTAPVVVAPTLPAGCLGVAQVITRTVWDGTTTRTITDIRQAAWYGNQFEDSDSFAPSWNSTTLTIAAGGIKGNTIRVTASVAETLRRSYRVALPATGDYDVRIRRVTADSDNDRIVDKATWSAIRTVTYRTPIALEGVNGTAVRIRGTDQLNGALDQWNAIVSNIIPDYDAATGTWISRATSNPASIYRFVLQGLGNARPLADSKVILADLEAWHVYCESRGYTYNRVIDYDTSVQELLRDIAAAGSASPAIVDGKRTIVVDGPKDDIVQVVTPRNSWGYKGEMTYTNLPHALRMQFRNAEKDYAQDERIVYNDGYSEFGEVPGTVAATLFEAIEVQSCTNSDLAWKIGRRYFAAAKLRPETHTFTMDIENLVALRGDRIKLVHDVPLVGIGDGRIKEVFYDDTDPDNILVTGIAIDDTVGVPTEGTYYTRIRLSDGTLLYKELVTAVGNHQDFMFAVPFAAVDSPAAGDLCLFVEAGGELDLIILSVTPHSDLSATLTCINYAPEVFTPEQGTIPSWSSNITTPLEFIRPNAPIFAGAVTDETAALRNLDGTILTRAVITLTNPNDNSVILDVKVRRSGDTEFGAANVLEATSERLVLTGLESGARYDIHLRYRRANGSVYSVATQLNNFLFVGVSSLPANVTGFQIESAGSVAILSWDANQDIDIDFYEIRHFADTTGATWGTSQTVVSQARTTRIPLPFQSGTYLIKAVDLSGNYSANATAILAQGDGPYANAVEILVEQPNFGGVKDNTRVKDAALLLNDPAILTGYYYFEQQVDLSEVFTSILSATVIANGAFVNNVYTMDDIFEVDDIFGSGNNNVFDMADIFAVEDIFGIGTDAWEVELQYRITNDNPGGSPVWSAWTPFNAGTLEFRAIEFRLRLTSFEEGISPSVSRLEVIIDMPDRVERGDDLTVPVGGTVITYPQAFKANPALTILLQDADENDYIEFVSKTAVGFEFKVYNAISGTYVERTYDFIASGYGRVSI